MRRQAEAGQLLIVFGREVKLQSAPAFAIEPNKIALRIQQQFDLLRRQHRVGNVQHTRKSNQSMSASVTSNRTRPAIVSRMNDANSPFNAM